MQCEEEELPAHKGPRNQKEQRNYDVKKRAAPFVWQTGTCLEEDSMGSNKAEKCMTAERICPGFQLSGLLFVMGTYLQPKLIKTPLRKVNPDNEFLACLSPRTTAADKGLVNHRSILLGCAVINPVHTRDRRKLLKDQWFGDENEWEDISRGSSAWWTAHKGPRNQKVNR